MNSRNDEKNYRPKLEEHTIKELCEILRTKPYYNNTLHVETVYTIIRRLNQHRLHSSGNSKPIIAIQDFAMMSADKAQNYWGSAFNNKLVEKPIEIKNLVLENVLDVINKSYSTLLAASKLGLKVRELKAYLMNHDILDIQSMTLGKIDLSNYEEYEADDDVEISKIVTKKPNLQSIDDNADVTTSTFTNTTSTISPSTYASLFSGKVGDAKDLTKTSHVGCPILAQQKVMRVNTSRKRKQTEDVVAFSPPQKKQIEDTDSLLTGISFAIIHLAICSTKSPQSAAYQLSCNLKSKITELQLLAYLKKINLNYLLLKVIQIEVIKMIFGNNYNTIFSDNILSRATIDFLNELALKTIKNLIMNNLSSDNIRNMLHIDADINYYLQKHYTIDSKPLTFAQMCDQSFKIENVSWKNKSTNNKETLEKHSQPQSTLSNNLFSKEDNIANDKITTQNTFIIHDNSAFTKYK